MQNTEKHDYPVSVTFYDTQLWKKVGLFYIAPSQHVAWETRKHSTLKNSLFEQRGQSQSNSEKVVQLITTEINTSSSMQMR